MPKVKLLISGFKPRPSYLQNSCSFLFSSNCFGWRRKKECEDKSGEEKEVQETRGEERKRKQEGRKEWKDFYSYLK